MTNEIEQQINLETAKIHWHELQRFFASGNAIAVDPSLDLTHVAAQIVADNAAQICSCNASKNAFTWALSTCWIAYSYQIR